VRIAADFTPPADTEELDAEGRPVPGPIDPDEARLAYVAVTRARHHLDLGGLSWINTRPATPATPLHKPSGLPARESRFPEGDPRMIAELAKSGGIGNDASAGTVSLSDHGP
jgi:hypothetical protein